MEESTTIFGIRTVLEAMESGKDIDKVYIQKGLSGPLFLELQKAVSSQSYNLSYVPVEKLNKLSKGNHQGVVAKISPITFRDMESVVQKALENDQKIPLLLLDQNTKARNFGATPLENK